MRKILLIEPNYKNKYPPIGLMKIATYHRLLGDRVKFFKGDINRLLSDEKAISCVEYLNSNFPHHDWNIIAISKYFKSRKLQDLHSIVEFVESDQNAILDILKFYAYNYRPNHYDRIYVTTLFTFYWGITVRTIEKAKDLVKDITEIKIGGVLASLLTNELEEETGIRPINGLLDKPGILDENDLVIDDLDLDYSILNEIDYKYPTGSAYFTFMTKGCTRKCAFCSVPILEPTYKDKVPTITKFDKIGQIYGDQKNLLLMDNNVLASPKFSEIISEIKAMGFYKGAKYEEPNQLDIAVKNLRSGFNDEAFIKLTFQIITQFSQKLKKDVKATVQETLRQYNLLHKENVTKDNLLKVYDIIQPIYEKSRRKNKVDRYVDFNQGIDARYVTDENMKLLSEINVRPLRIAFDFIGMEKQYIAAVELAAKHGIVDLSNYLLYNFKDKPQELYLRMKINVELNKKYGLKIFSFPMKYIPLFGNDAKNRKYVSKQWNKKFIRAIQCMLNVTKGIVAPGYEFFFMAFGNNIEEFMELLYMPEQFIIHRNKFKESGITSKWRQTYRSLNLEEQAEAKLIIEKNDFKNIEQKTTNPRIYNLLRFYTIKIDEVGLVNLHNQSLLKEFNRMFKNDPFLNLTLTYDYEKL